MPTGLEKVSFHSNPKERQCQRMLKVKSESEVAQSCPTLSHSMDCSLPGSSVHGPYTGPTLVESGAQLTHATVRWCVDGCVADRQRVGAQGEGRMPGPLPALQDTHFGLQPPSREQASMFCFGIN